MTRRPTPLLWYPAVGGLFAVAVFLVPTILGAAWSRTPLGWSLIVASAASLPLLYDKQSDNR